MKTLKTIGVALAVLALSMLAFGGCGSNNNGGGSSGTSFFPTINI